MTQTLPTQAGSIITGATEDYEGDEGHWLMTGEERVFTDAEVLKLATAYGEFTVLRVGLREIYDRADTDYWVSLGYSVGAAILLVEAFQFTSDTDAEIIERVLTGTSR